MAAGFLVRFFGVCRRLCFRFISGFGFLGLDGKIFLFSVVIFGCMDRYFLFFFLTSLV